MVRKKDVVVLNYSKKLSFTRKSHFDIFNLKDGQEFDLFV